MPRTTVGASRTTVTLMAIYPVSTSKFGLGDAPGSSGTPLGRTGSRGKNWRLSAQSAQSSRIDGERAKSFAGFAGARSDCDANSLVARTRTAERERLCPRYIYIHGTPEERNIGLPASYGCIRMRSSDIIQLYDIVGRRRASDHRRCAPGGSRSRLSLPGRTRSKQTGLNAHSVGWQRRRSAPSR